MAAKPAAPARAVDTMVNMAMPIASYPLIARQALFGNPVKSAGRLSPDGKWVSYLAPRDGVMNVRFVGLRPVQRAITRQAMIAQ